MYGPYMTRDQRIELRVSEDERDQFQALADKHGLSVGETIRRLLMNPVLVADGKSVVESALPPPLTDNPHVSPEMKAKSITELARQRHGHLPLGAAERKVREELR